MTYLRNSILATIIYYDILDFPLTLLEIYKYMINPGRLTRFKDSFGEITPGLIVEELDKLVSSKIIGHKNGFYFLDGRENLYNLRMEKDKLANQKWKKFLRYCYWLQLAPFLRGIFASGSMAISNTDEKSDFDVLIIAKAGRLYSCRLFLWLVSSLMGVRRKKYERVAPDKLCFNHFITDRSLTIVHESLYNAQTYINLKPVFVSSELIGEFYGANLWLNNYAYNFKIQKNFVRRGIKPNKVILGFMGMIERIMDSCFRNILEGFMKRKDRRRIFANPLTYESGGRVISNEGELEFHPHSAEKKILERYKDKLTRFGIVPPFDEKDSGLK